MLASTNISLAFLHDLPAYTRSTVTKWLKNSRFTSFRNKPLASLTHRFIYFKFYYFAAIWNNFVIAEIEESYSSFSKFVQNVSHYIVFRTSSPHRVICLSASHIKIYVNTLNSINIVFTIQKSNNRKYYFQVTCANLIKQVSMQSHDSR